MNNEQRRVSAEKQMRRIERKAARAALKLKGAFDTSPRKVASPINLRTPANVRTVRPLDLSKFTGGVEVW